MNKIIEQMVGDLEFLRIEFLKIHQADQQAYAEQYIHRNRKKFYYVVILFAVLILLQCIKTYIFSTGPYITDGEYINGIHKPQNGSFSTELVVEMDDGDSVLTRKIPINLTMEGEDEKKNLKNETNLDTLKNGAAEYQLKNKLQELIQEEKNILMLPGKLNEDITLRWSVENKDGVLVTGILFIASLLLLYLTRYQEFNKLKAQYRESVINELPEFTNKVVLLLNAGLIFHTVLQRILRKEAEKETATYFMSQMLGIQKRVEETNSSLIVELRSFALATEVREFIRLVSMIEDNIKKGAVLAEKMERESELLLEARKKNLQEKIRISETKLSFPMAIQLIVLIGITIAPAMI